MIAQLLTTLIVTNAADRNSFRLVSPNPEKGDWCWNLQLTDEGDVEIGAMQRYGYARSHPSFVSSYVHFTPNLAAAGEWFLEWTTDNSYARQYTALNESQVAELVALSAKTDDHYQQWLDEAEAIYRAAHPNE